MTVIPLDGTVFEVHCGGAAYKVDLAEQTCTCLDHQFRGVKCKHIWRVEIGIQKNPKGENPVEKEIRARLRCYCAPGKKKKYKFWGGIPHFPQFGTLLLWWGDCNDFELEYGAWRGQTMEIQCSDPYTELQRRSIKKLDRGYNVVDPALYDKIVTLLARRFRKKVQAACSSSEACDSAAETEAEAEEEKRIDWSSMDCGGWF